MFQFSDIYKYTFLILAKYADLCKLKNAYVLQVSKKIVCFYNISVMFIAILSHFKTW